MAALMADGLTVAESAASADLVVVNTCAFIEAAREESIDVVLGLSAARKSGAKVVATGCMAERYGNELAAALPEVDAVIGFAGAGSIAQAVGMLPASFQPINQLDQPVTMRRKPVGVRDLLELPRPKSQTPWAYLKVAEGCDRACAFCAIPTFRGKQRSRSTDSVVNEARGLVADGVREIVLVAQDLAWYGRDIDAPGALTPLLVDLDQLRSEGLERIRLLYLYPSEVRDPLVSTMLELPSVVPYFDLSLQHASRPLLARMKRWGSGAQFLDSIAAIRAAQPDAVFRSSFICGFPGETESMHSEMLSFLDAAQLDWAGFFSYSQEDGTTAVALDGAVDADVIRERLGELHAVQEPITAASRQALLGTVQAVLVDGLDEDDHWIGRTFRESPEIDGVVRLEPDPSLHAGVVLAARITGCEGPDLFGEVAANVGVK